MVIWIVFIALPHRLMFRIIVILVLDSNYPVLYFFRAIKKLSIILAMAISLCVNAKEIYFYVGSRIDNPLEPITLFSINLESGELNRIKAFSGVKSSDYISISPDRKFLYSVDTQRIDQHGLYESVAAFALDESTGEINFLNRQSTFGNGSCYLSNTPDNRFLLVANYITGNLVVLPINEDGSLSPLVSMVKNYGTGPNKKRQEKAHSHYIHMANDGKHILSADLGSDKVMNYRLSKEGQLYANPNQAFIKMPPGGGPRHLAFHDNGKYLYILNELTSKIMASEIDLETGVVEVIQEHPLLPSDFKEFNKSSAIRIHPNGKYLYASNRGHDSITAFEILSDGNIKRIQIQQDGTEWVRDFHIDPTGEYMVVGNVPLNQLRTFEIAEGLLVKTDFVAEVASPAAIKFLK